jgi:hypothetical protein
MAYVPRLGTNFATLGTGTDTLTDLPIEFSRRRR